VNRRPACYRLVSGKKQARCMVRNKYRRWTQEDDRRLLELRAAGRSAVSISAVLKRTVGAVQGRLSILRALAKSPKLQEEATQDHS
jgi:hypothetical protein